MTAPLILTAPQQAVLEVLGRAGHGTRLDLVTLARAMSSSTAAAQLAGDALFRKELALRDYSLCGEPGYRITTAGRDWLAANTEG